MINITKNYIKWKETMHKWRCRYLVRWMKIEFILVPFNGNIEKKNMKKKICAQWSIAAHYLWF